MFANHNLICFPLCHYSADLVSCSLSVLPGTHTQAHTYLLNQTRNRGVPTLYSDLGRKFNCFGLLLFFVIYVVSWSHSLGLVCKEESFHKALSAL